MVIGYIGVGKEMCCSGGGGVDLCGVLERGISGCCLLLL